MRKRRPERYSDSLESTKVKPSKSLLEYHLDSLTNRSQENEFERFCRMIAERLLCPNLLPQTGPTGGGDSKVDSETYPVAPEIAISWYQGTDSANERWAFAFSAKKDWRPKLKSDIRKIAETKRGYKVAYFISNQFVRDKSRAELEDQLSSEHSIDVRILDRTWIVEKVEQNDLWKETAETLEITGLITSSKKLGPNDQRRIAELSELDKKASDPTRYRGIPYQQVMDCITSAKLASELERDRHEVYGRFQAAVRIADETGNPRLQIRALYAFAWNTHCYYDDHTLTSELYGRLETLCLDSNLAGDLSDLNNIWNLLFTAVSLQKLDPAKIDFKERSERLEECMVRLSADPERLNNATESKILLGVFRLVKDLTSGRTADEMETHIQGLIEAFKAVEGLRTFPFEEYREFILDAEEIASACPHFDKLYDLVLDIHAQRSSDAVVGETLTSRAWRKFESNKFYDAIRACGRAQRFLLKQENEPVLYDNLSVIGLSYKAVGLKWAAKSSLISAVSLSLRCREARGGFHPSTWLLLRQLAWIDLEKGNISEVLIYLRMAHLSLKGHPEEKLRMEKLADFFHHIDQILAILLLKTPLDELDHLNRFHDHLCIVGLETSKRALLFALGHRKAIEAEFEAEGLEAEKIEDFFAELYNQPARDQIPDGPQLYCSESIRVSTRILGAEIIFITDTDKTLLLITGSLLAMLESFFATSFTQGVFPQKEEFSIRVKRSSEKIEADFHLSEGNAPEISVSPTFRGETSQEMAQFKDLSAQLLGRLFAEAFLVSDFEGEFSKVVEEEQIFDRSNIFTELFNPYSVVFEDWPWYSTAFFNLNPDAKFYPLQRAKKWPPEEKVREVEAPPARSDKQSSQFEDRMRHDEAKFHSLINKPLWDEAEWRGVLYLWTDSPDDPPCLGLVFTNQESAKQIFNEWTEKLGGNDLQNKIRISIITEIDRRNPSHYKVVVSPSLDIDELKEGSFFMGMSRIHLMEPSSKDNLENFLNRYNQTEPYWLTAAILSDDKRGCKLLKGTGSKKTGLEVRPAWKIGPNDPDICALHPNDDPIIPDGEIDPPVYEALEQLRKIHRRRKK